MKRDGVDVVVVIIALIATALISFIIGGIVFEPVGYKQGQVDALTGHISYELVTQPDSTRIWEEIK